MEHPLERYAKADLGLQRRALEIEPVEFVATLLHLCVNKGVIVIPDAWGKAN